MIFRLIRSEDRPAGHSHRMEEQPVLAALVIELPDCLVAADQGDHASLFSPG
jgi:hypothetical protein